MTPPADLTASGELGESVKRAVIWRTGSQIASQVVAWGATLLVIRILDPADYGLFAMTQVVIVFLNFLNGYGFAGSLIREPELTEHKIRQAFGLLLLVNGALALLQVCLAPLAAAYYHQPMVAQLLRVQALIFLSTPFISIPEVLLMRQMDFRRQALVNIVATIVSAAVALGGALGGWGVWTLVWAPIALFWTRAVGLQVATRAWHWPSFRFAGTGPMFQFGLALLASTFGWTVINQADTLIAARRLSPHDLGLYAEALFLTTLIASKFVPPLNEVAFPAYARMQEDRALLAASFLKAVRLVMLVTCPLYLGLSVVAPDAVTLVLGVKWRAMAPLMTILAFSMPVQTLHILFAPAVNAIGHIRITMRASLLGALIMPPAFLFGLQWGATGLAYAWLLAFPLLPLFTFLQARAKLGIDARRLAAAVAPGALASLVMALAVFGLGRGLGALAPWQRLGLEVAFGGACYAGLLLIFARDAVLELAGLASRRPELARPAAA
jgi:O-antigen/teichoic acid export membrane protein